MVDVEALEGRADLGAEDAVFVRLGAGVEAGVKIGRGLFDGRYANIAREQAIDGSAEIVGRDGIRQIKCRDLGQSMNARVSAAGAFNADG